MEYLKVWTDFREVMEPLNDAEKGRLFDAMLLYADNGEEPHLTGNERFVWAIARQSIDRARAQSETLRINGSKGGRPKKQEEPNETKEKQKEPAKRFVKPTVDEVRAYCKERRNNVDAEKFVDFYSSKGWKVGGQPMKDWKACCRTWERSNGKTVTAQQYDQRDYRNAEENPDDVLERLGGQSNV